MTRLGLTLNEAKTNIKAARKESFHFLGYTFGPHRYKPDGHWYLGASPSTAYREVNNYVAERVRHFLTRCHKVQSRGTERYGDERVFGELRVIRLGPPPRLAGTLR